MKIAVMGAGGMGGWLGARLATSNNDVSFIARGAHLAAMQDHGLKISGADSIYLPDVFATDTPHQIGTVDVVLFCVKLYDTEQAAKAIRPLLGPETVVLTVQNGVDSAQRISAQIGDGHTLSGAAYFPAHIAAPGQIEYVGRIGGKPHIAFGEPGAGVSDRVQALSRQCQDAGIETEVFTDTESSIWEKFCLVAATSATTALTRQCVGVVRSDPHMRWMLKQAIAEASAVGRESGVRLRPDLDSRTLASIDQNPADGKASQLIDLERGRRLELDGLSGRVVKLGKKLGVPTPVHSTVYAALKPYIDGGPKNAD